jgi:hypothetical protein
MKPTTKETGERRKAERRNKPAERRADPARAITGDRRVVENRGIGASMVDALEDILAWERASERTLKAAAEAASVKDLPN